MKIVERKFYDGSEQRIKRLGLSCLIEEAEELLKKCQVTLAEEKNANGGAALRRLLDEHFKKSKEWIKVSSGGIDWTKCRTVGETRICIGIEIQVSARSNLVIRDVIHLRDELENGKIDVGVIVVPSDRMAHYLPSRAPTWRETVQVIHDARATHMPLLLIGIEHDGPGVALPKDKDKRDR